ncbi:MAG: GNAT family N-acetyltransferase [Phycisphaerales bacterium]|nr:GNAT family N-acetyltransferase [Phycisphaerales bacterium]
MAIRIEILSDMHESDYVDLCHSDPSSLLFHTLAYRRFLEMELSPITAKYLLAYDGDNLVGALPAMLMQGPKGVVANSLPFYGSNGGFIGGETATESVRKCLLDSFDDMCQEHDVVVSTIVANPLRDDREWMIDVYKPDFQDSRIGQLTPLPSPGSEAEDTENLMAMFHQKTRNMVRKGVRSGFDVDHEGSEEAMRGLHQIHTANMAAIGGQAKNWSAFAAIRECFEYEQDYRVYTARRSGQLEAALLVFRSNLTAEYFTPVVSEASRSDQPLSHLILMAMMDSMHDGCEWWNWGGTWLSQEGVYRFKSRWGTEDRRYSYLVKAHQDLSDLGRMTPRAILDAYPGFYVLPFSELESHV